MIGISEIFSRQSIVKKMLLGYLPLAFLILIIAVFALSSLERLNTLNSAIIKTYVPLIEATDNMVDTVFSQEFYGKRYVILKSPEMLELFWRKSEEFNNLIDKITFFTDKKDLKSITSLHTDYNNLFVKVFQNIGGKTTVKGDVYSDEIKVKQRVLVDLIQKISLKARKEQNEKTLAIAYIGNNAFRVTALLGVLGIALGIGAALIITRNISGSINKLMLATKEVSEGRFDYTPDTENHDELGELSHAFSEMTKRLKRLEEMYLDTSPLTRLPGGIAIENVLIKRIETGKPLAFCLLDMDHFKSFSDRYGYARGSDVIQATARIVEDAVRKHGTVEDFVGHIGGDDFVIVTSPERYRKICTEVIEVFDRKIPDFYNPADKERGFITGKNRQGQIVTFPITTISIAVVTNLSRHLTSHIQISELAAELKEYAKSIPGSNFVVDERRENRSVKDNDHHQETETGFENRIINLHSKPENI